MSRDSDTNKKKPGRKKTQKLLRKKERNNTNTCDDYSLWYQNKNKCILLLFLKNKL